MIVLVVEHKQDRLPVENDRAERDHMRGMLIEVAWVVWRKNAWAQVFVSKVSRGMKSRKKIAIVALARRLLVKLWAMLRTNTPWHALGPPPAPALRP